MAKEKSAAKPAAKTEPKRPVIAVSQLRFRQDVDLPGKSMTSGLKANRQANRNGYEIEYLPWMRSFRISHFKGDEVVAQRHVCETNVLYWDAES